MIPEQVRWLQVENTTRCNAWCPACARNKNGFGLSDTFELHDLEIDRFKQVLELFPNLDTVQFCGTYGDTMASPMTMSHILLAKQYANKLQIHTHGGIRSTHWWQKLADQLKDIDHDVWFAIDGLKGVHEIYRQGTDFDKTIDNATAFINSGGHATWQFIPWAHNEHQLKECMVLSQRLGFKKFKVVKSVRENFQGRHWKTGDPIEFKGWSHDHRFNHFVQIPTNKRQVVHHKDCMHLSSFGVYLNANGRISPCCWFNIGRSFEDFSALPDIVAELNSEPHKTCLRDCGSAE